MPKQNQGEKDEVETIRRLISIGTNPDHEKAISMFGNCASEGFQVLDPDTNHVLKENEINNYKSKSLNKCDCLIRFCKDRTIIKPSIKSSNGAAYTLLNHTHNQAKCWNLLEIQNPGLKSAIDDIVKVLNRLRTDEDHGEDFKLDAEFIKEHFTSDVEILKKHIGNLLKYFIYEGSGRGYSKNQADSVIVLNGKDIVYESIDCEALVDEGKLSISLRKKGMPKKLQAEHEKWTCEKYPRNGALHIRRKK